MVETEPTIAEDVVILDSGSDVSLLPPAVNPEEVQLRGCQGKHLHVTGYRTVPLVVRGFEDHVKSCILSLGQLYMECQEPWRWAVFRKS